MVFTRRSGRSGRRSVAPEPSRCVTCGPSRSPGRRQAARGERIRETKLPLKARCGLFSRVRSPRVGLLRRPTRRTVGRVESNDSTISLISLDPVSGGDLLPQLAWVGKDYREFGEIREAFDGPPKAVRMNEATNNKRAPESQISLLFVVSFIRDGLLRRPPVDRSALHRDPPRSPDLPVITNSSGLRCK